MRRTLPILAVLGLAALGIAAFAMKAAERVYLQEGSTRATATLDLTLKALEGHLRRFETVPDLLADNDRVRAVLANPADPAGRMALNLWLDQRNTELDALDIYVMTPNGDTIAASNYEKTDSFIGKNFSYRPYFQQALAGGKGRFYAIGTTSGVRGYYFAAPVKVASGQTMGVIAVKIGLDVTEAEWRSQEARIVVTDPDAIIFLSSYPNWLYNSLTPLPPDRQLAVQQSRRYDDLVPATLDSQQITRTGVTLATLPDTDGTRHNYIMVAKLLPRADMTVRVLLNTRPLYAQVRLSVAALMLFLGGLMAIAIVILQRRAQLTERLRLEEQAKAELEHRVDERTADLARLNQLMEAEVAERRLTEAELRRTQGDLVQAGKLAALGQMSAALSHEINQPLAAARNYADSTSILLNRGDIARAKGNVDQILSLIDRMAAIARHLRNVARKPDTQLKDITLAAAVAEAIIVMDQRLNGITVTQNLPEDLPLVRGGPVRLQQVLVNLISNAADAVTGLPHPEIIITAKAQANRVILTVQDNGPGVPSAIVDRIFDPFFTTKRVGSGLGLGLSISFNIMKDFGGDLRVTNAVTGGAIFAAEFNASPRLREAAE